MNAKLHALVLALGNALQAVIKHVVHSVYLHVIQNVIRAVHRHVVQLVQVLAKVLVLMDALIHARPVAIQDALRMLVRQSALAHVVYYALHLVRPIVLINV